MNYADMVMADAPWCYWRLNESSGSTVLDATVNHRNGTITGSPTMGAPGLPGDTTGIRFTGTASTYILGAEFNSSIYTQEIWVNLAATPGTGTAICGLAQGGANSATYEKLLTFDTSRVSHLYEWQSTTPQTLNGPTFVLGTWHHVVGQYDGSNASLYVDGLQVASLAMGASYAGYTAPNVTICPTTQAASVPPYTGWLNGTVAHYALYSTALSLAQIAAHYKAGTRSGVSY